MSENAEAADPKVSAGWTWRMCLSGAAVLLVTAIALPVAWADSQAGGLLAAGCAALVCGGCSIAASMIGRFFAHPRQVAFQVLFTMAIRTGVPLIFFLLVYSRGGPLVEAGMVYYLLAYYFALWLVEIGLMAATKRVPGHSGKVT